MKPDAWYRIRAACSDESGLSPEELEAHADAVTVVVVEAQTRSLLAFRMHEPLDEPTERSAA